jgi:MFS family permease
MSPDLRMPRDFSPFVTVCLAMVVGVMGTALISPLYALYKEAWNLQPSDVSLIYVIYMVGALTGLLFLGRLPDRIGFVRVMGISLVLGLIGTFISMIAWNTTSLIVGRVVVGISSTMMTTGATLGLTTLSRAGSLQRTAMVTGFLMALGFGLGPLMGGIFGEWLPWPLVTTYLPSLVLGVWGLHSLYRLRLPAHVRPPAAAAQPMGWHDFVPHLTLPAPAQYRVFAITCALPFVAFAVFGVYASMAPLFLEKLVPWHGPFMSGISLAMILLVSACVQILAGSWPTYLTGMGGAMALVISNALLIANFYSSSALLFGAGVLCTAAGHGMCMLAGMSMINRIAEPGSRSGLLATYLVVGYVGSIAPMMAMGWMADHWGLRASVTVFACMIIAVGSGVATAFRIYPGMRQGDDGLPAQR